MATLPQSSVLSKVVVVMSLLAFTLYLVGGLIPQWIEAEFVIPAFPPIIPAPLSVDSHMGLRTSCKTISMMGTVVEDTCTIKGARDWQKAATGLGIVGAVGGLVGLVLAVLNVTVSKVSGKKPMKIAIAASSLAAAGFSGGAIAIYAVNKRIQVRPPLPLEIEYDFGWAFAVSAVSTGFYVVITILALVDICSKPNRGGAMHWTSKNEEASVHYTNSVMK